MNIFFKGNFTYFYRQTPEYEVPQGLFGAKLDPNTFPEQQPLNKMYYLMGFSHNFYVNCLYSIFVISFLFILTFFCSCLSFCSKKCNQMNEKKQKEKEK
jgi:hypothetical protein